MKIFREINEKLRKRLGFNTSTKYLHNIKVVINTAKILYCGILRLIFVGLNVLNSIKMNQ